MTDIKRRSFLGLLAVALPAAAAAPALAVPAPVAPVVDDATLEMAKAIAKLSAAMPDPLRMLDMAKVREHYDRLNTYPTECIFECRPEDLTYFT